MIRSPIPQLEMWLLDLREKLRLDGRKRFLFLLICFNALLIAILLLSVRNQEIRQRIRVVELDIARQIERLATIQANQVFVVYITETPTVRAIAAVTPTATSLPPTPTDTAPPTSVSRDTPRPTETREPTATQPPGPTPSTTPTVSPSPTPATVTPTNTPTLTLTPTTTSTPTSPPPTRQPPRVTTVLVTASPTTIVADGATTTVIRAQVLDQFGRPIRDGTQVTFTTDRGEFWGASSVVVLTSAGIAEATLTSETSSGVATVYATAASTSGSTTVTFAAGEPDQIDLTATPDRLPVTGTSTLRAVVRDRFGNRVADRTTVTFETTLGTLGTTSVSTSNGIAQTTLSSNAVGTATVTARAGSSTRDVTVEFVPIVEITKTADRSVALAGSVLTYTIVIQNNSPAGAPAQLTSLRDTLPTDFDYVPGSTVSSAFAGDPAIDGQRLTWTPSPAPYDLDPGDTIVSSFRVTTPTTSGTYFNRATIRGDNFDPIRTGDTAPVTLQGPTITSITPAQGCNDAPVAVTIEGNQFAPGITARLGTWTLLTTWIDENTLNAVVPQDIAAGTYDLTVTNPGGANDTLPNAYTAQNCGSFDTTLDSTYLGTYGAEASFSEIQGDDDQVQVIFLEVPDTTTSQLYIRIFDPDCGDTIDLRAGPAWDTPFTYTVYGGSGAYTDLDARSSHPTTGISTGQVRASAVFTENAGTDASWYTFGPLSPTEGELVGNKRIFKLAVVGGPEPPFTPAIGYADLNLYNVALSISPTTNDPPAESRIWSYSWTFAIPQATYATPPRMFPYVDTSVTTLTQHNWDYDNTPAGTAGITITTPIRTIIGPDADVSADNLEATSSYNVQSDERGTTWAIHCWAEPTGLNLVTFWATDQTDRDLPLFARSTIAPPP